MAHASDLKKPWFEIIEGMSNEDYHAHHGIGKSGLDRVRRSIAHYQQRPTATPSAPMIEGSAFHCRVLEPEHWGTRYAVAPDLDRRTKAGKAAWAECQEESKGLTVLTPEQDARIEKMTQAIDRHPVWESIGWGGGDVEVSVFWEELLYSQAVTCKSRPDFVSADKNILVDLKSTRDASPEAFAKSVANFRYHVQAAWYLRGWRAATQIDADFVFLAVESSPPHEVACYTLGEAELAEGWMQATDSLRKFAAWKSGELKVTGYPAEIQELNLPRWAFEN